MSFLRPEDAQAIREEFEKNLSENVLLSLIGPSALNPPAEDLTSQIRELAQEICNLAPKKLSLEYVDMPSPEQSQAFGLELGQGGPILIIQGKAQGRVRYVGAPSGHEFPSFIRSIIDVSRGESGLSAASRKALAQITTPVHIQVFFTPTCPYCPMAAGLAHAIAIDNANVTADAVEANEFPELATRYRVTGVPKTVVNNRVEFVGALPEAEFVQHVLEGAGIQG